MRSIVRPTRLLGAACAAAVLATTVLARPATGAVVYSNTTGTPYVNSFGPAPELDDVTLPAGTGPVSLTGISFGYHNSDTLPAAVDALIRFYNTANTGATGSDVVESGPLGAPQRLVIGPVLGNASVTQSFALPVPISITDGNLAVAIEFVDTGTSTPSGVVDALLSPNLPTVGSSVDRYWSDYIDSNESFSGDEIVRPDLAAQPPLHANLYLELDGQQVPEPAVSGLAAVAGGLLLARRRRRAV